MCGGEGEWWSTAVHALEDYTCDVGLRTENWLSPQQKKIKMTGQAADKATGAKFKLWPGA